MSNNDLLFGTSMNPVFFDPIKKHKMFGERSLEGRENAVEDVEEGKPRETFKEEEKALEGRKNAVDDALEKASFEPGCEISLLRTVSPQGTDKLVRYMEGLSEIERKPFKGLVEVLEQYSKLAVEGENCPNEDVERLFNALTITELPIDQSIKERIGEAKQNPSRLNKVIAIDCIIHGLHEDCSLIGKIVGLDNLPRFYPSTSRRKGKNLEEILTNFEEIVKEVLDEISKASGIDEPFEAMRKGTRAGLVPKKVQIERGGKIFQGVRYVRSSKLETLSGAKIPKGWTDVWVAEDPKAKVQAYGRDAAGRPVYIRSADAEDKAQVAKFARVKEFDSIVNDLRKKVLDQVEQDEEAAILYIIMQTAFRPGTTKDTKAKERAYGVTTLLGKHITVDGNEVTFDFIGKKGVSVKKTIEDPVMAKIFRERIKGPEDEIFEVGDDKVRKYLKKISGKPFKVKDIRTHIGNQVAYAKLKEIEPPTTEKDLIKKKMSIATAVAKILGNTPAVSLKSYISPEVFTPWEAVIEYKSLSKSEHRLYELVQYDKIINWRSIPDEEEDEDDDYEEIFEVKSLFELVQEEINEGQSI